MLANASSLNYGPDAVLKLYFHQLAWPYKNLHVINVSSLQRQRLSNLLTVTEFKGEGSRVWWWGVWLSPRALHSVTQLFSKQRKGPGSRGRQLSVQLLALLRTRLIVFIKYYYFQVAVFSSLKWVQYQPLGRIVRRPGWGNVCRVTNSSQALFSLLPLFSFPFFHCFFLFFLCISSSLFSVCPAILKIKRCYRSPCSYLLSTYRFVT